ncbi:MAG: 2-amino-4-hydroxy-6-hydroxymethyldihydropteridine diphosphokinase [Chthoniobacterales bacterium]
MKAAVAVGSNLGDRFANLKNARAKISAAPGVLPPVRSSAIYETEPIGCETGAPKFLNAVVAFEYEGDASALLRTLVAIEEAGGRPHTHAKNVSRTLDLDLLFFGDVEVNTAELQVPHPRIAKRPFVLAPLADVCPDLILPRHTSSVRELLRRLDESDALVRFSTQW